MKVQCKCTVAKTIGEKNDIVLQALQDRNRYGGRKQREREREQGEIKQSQLLTFS